MNGPIDQFNQTVLVQAPAGGHRGRRADPCCRPCWIGIPCCGYASLTGVFRGDRGLVVWLCPNRVRWLPLGACTPSDVLSEDAVIAARARLNPAAGVMLSALWVARSGPTGGDRSSPGHRRGVVADPARRSQCRLGPTPPRTADSPACSRDLVCPLGIAAGRGPARRPDVVEQADAWKRVAATPGPAAGRISLLLDTYASAGHLSMSLEIETTRQAFG